MFNLRKVGIALAACAVPLAGVKADGSWRDPVHRISLDNDALHAEFQSGILFRVADKKSGSALMSMDPARLKSIVPIFATTGINLDECARSQQTTADSVVSRFRAPDGTRWELHWSIEPGDGDLVLHTSVRATAPIAQFRLILPGLDITGHKIVLINGTGSGIERTAPWSETLGGSVPVVLFEGKESGWFVEARELDAGTASVSAVGHGGMVDVTMVRAYPAITRAPGPVEIRLRRYDTNWPDAVDPYLAWMAEEARYVPIEAKQPSWVKQIRAQAYLYPWEFEGLELLAKRVDPSKTLLGRVTDFNRLPFPFYEPSETSKQWFKRARELGFHVGAHVNTTGVVPDNRELVARFHRGFLEIWTDADGKEKWETAPPHAGRVTAKTPDGDKIVSGVGAHAYCSPALKDFRDFFVEQLRPLVDAGVDLIYLDECGGTGRAFIDGMTSTQGVMLMMKQITEAYPHVALMTEQFNPVICKYASFALTTLDPGHPLSGYIFSRFIKVVPEWSYYEPTNEKQMDEHQAWGFMVPGASWNASWLQIAKAFTTYNFVPDARMPLGPDQLFGYMGSGGVKAYYEKQDKKRGLVVYEAGKDPTWHGTRATGITSWPGPGALEDWPLYDGNTLISLNPKHTYGFDENVTLRPDRFHVTSVPSDFVLYASEKQRKRTIPIEVGRDGAYFRITFTGNGELKMNVPDEWIVCLDDSVVAVDPKTRRAIARIAAPKDQPSVLLAFVKSDRELAGEAASLPWQIPTKQQMNHYTQCYTENTHYAHRSEYAGILIGRVPRASKVLLQTAGEGVVRVNGKPILQLPGGERLEADLTPYAGQHAIVEFSADGGGWTAYRRPAFWQSLWPGITVEEKKGFGIGCFIAEKDGFEWWLQGGWVPRITVVR